MLTKIQIELNKNTMNKILLVSIPQTVHNFKIEDD